MPQVELDKLIGLNLKAAKKLSAYNFPEKPNKVLFTIPSGGNAGKVYSWIERPDGIWLQFKRSSGTFYYILADQGAFNATDQVLQAYKVQQAEQEQELIKTKGAVPYYIEKYGVWVLGGVLVISILPALIKRK